MYAQPYPASQIAPGAPGAFPHPQQQQYQQPQYQQQPYQQQPYQQYGYPGVGGGGGGGGGKPAAYPHPPPVALHVAPAPSAAEDKYIDNAEKAVRMGFIRKVYAILSLQLAVTLSLVLAFAYSPALAGFVQARPAVLVAAIVLTFVFLFALSCFPTVARTYPTNFLCLAGFTLCQSLLVGTIASTYAPDTVVKAVVATGAITLGLTLFAFQTRIDFTGMSSAMFCLLIVLLLFGVWMAIFPSQVASTAYAALGAFVFSLFIVYDTQLIIGGKHHSHQFSVDEYVFAALTIYIVRARGGGGGRAGQNPAPPMRAAPSRARKRLTTLHAPPPSLPTLQDIIQLFLFMLRLFGSRD